MSQEKTFTFILKNDQTITLKFSPIVATGNRLWQMFATTEALDIVDQIINASSTLEKTSIAKKKPIVTKTPVKKKK
jgi:hypothetical protein